MMIVLDRTVAVADDSELIRSVVRTAVQNMDACSLTIEAESGEELLAMLSRTHPLPDILFLDISLPGMNGYAVMRELSKQYPQIRVVALSIYVEEFSVTQMIRLGAWGFLDKNRLEDIGSAVDHARRNERYFSAGIARSWTRRASQFEKPVSITKREMQLIRMCASGSTFRKVASELTLSERTIYHYREELYDKLGVRNVGAMVRVAVGSGLIRIGAPLP